jgi:hypothetical protein
MLFLRGVRSRQGPWRASAMQDARVIAMRFHYAPRMRAAILTPAAIAFECEQSWHSQATITLQPAARSCLAVQRSRATFRSNFATQKSVLLFGVVAILQPECRCQKHPCTNTTVRKRGKTRSGLPGRFAACSLYRRPSPCSTFRRAISGLVSRPLIRLMRSERPAGDRKSAMPYSQIRVTASCRARRTEARGSLLRMSQRTCRGSDGWGGS